MKIMNKLAALIAAMAMCMTSISTSVSAKTLLLKEEGDYNETQTEEIVTEEEIPVEEEIPTEEDAASVEEEAAPEEAVPSDEMPEETPQEEPALPAQEETPDEDSESEVYWDHLTPKEPLTLVQDEFYTVILDPVEHAYCRFSEEETVEGLIKVGRLTVVPDGVCRVTRLYATDQNGKVIDGLVPKGGTSDPISMSVAGVPSVEYYTFTFHVEVDSMYLLSLDTREAYHIPVSISSERAHAGDKIKVNVEETAGYTPSIGITFGNGKTEWHKNVWSYEFEMPADNVYVEVHLDAELYSIDIQSVEHLEVKVYTEWNEEITTSRADLYLHLVIDADPPYVVDNITYLDADGNLIDGLSGWSQFTMPAQNLKINVTEKKHIKYVDENGTEHVREEYTNVSEVQEGVGYGLSDGWYVLDKDVTFNEHRMTITGDVNLILCDGATLNVAKGIRCGSDYNGGNNSLTIWGQEDQTGAIVCNQIDRNDAAIGGNNKESAGIINIHGGNVTAAGAPNGAGIGGGGSADGGTINIYHGIVNAVGGNAWNGAGAGIGGGNHGNGGNINIYGGEVTATGANWGAGIGGGNCGNGGNIAITGGTIHAKGGRRGASIGGGDEGSGGVINIAGGTIEAISYLEGGAGIGGGKGGDGGNITFTGGNIVAQGSNGGAGVGGGCSADGGTITIEYVDSLTAQSGNSKNWSLECGDSGGAGIGGGEDGNGGTITIYGGNINAFGGKNAAGVQRADYDGGAGAGIGGGDNEHGGHICIYGGNIKAIGGCTHGSLTGSYDYSGAGIGGGDDGDSGTIEIYGGSIYAESSNKEGNVNVNSWGAGIGAGGDDGNVEYIAIHLGYGGSIHAKGYHSIGCGDDGSEKRGTLWIADWVKTVSGTISGNEVVLCKSD